MTPGYRESHLGRGDDYDEGWDTIAHRSMMWALERRVLSALLRAHAPKRPLEYLDFACGTGRVLAHVGPGTARATGVDIAESMLRVARGRCPEAELICSDLTREAPLVDRSFDLITAFRFFPNAEEELRGEVAQQLARLLRPDGILVLNNHRNPNSSFNLLLRATGRYEAPPPEVRFMRHEDVVALTNSVGLRITANYPLGILPMEEGFFFGPRGMVEAAERGLRHLPGVRRVASNTIYVCRRV